MVAEEGLEYVNLYDLLANIVPGISFLFGLAIPLNIYPVAKAVFASPPPDFNLAVLILLLILAFIIGQVLQAIAGEWDGDHGWENYVKAIKNSDSDSRYPIGDFDEEFWENCKDCFDIDEQTFDSYDRLLKLVLSELESSGRSRALRLQALYLFVRGVSASLLFLIVFLLIALAFSIDPPSSSWGPYLRHPAIIWFGIFGLMFLRYVTDKEKESLEEDWILYTVLEFNRYADEEL